MKKLAINRCPIHREFWAIIIEDEHGGIRHTPSKCCGQWDLVRSWALTARAWRELAEEANTIADTLEKSAEARK